MSSLRLLSVPLLLLTCVFKLDESSKELNFGSETVVRQCLIDPILIANRFLFFWVFDSTDYLTESDLLFLLDSV